MEQKKKQGRKPNFTLLCTLLTAALLAGLCLVALLTGGRAGGQAAGDGTDSVELIEEREPEILRLEPTPEPTPLRYALPAGAVEVLCDGAPVCALDSRAQAEALLAEYLEQSRIESETERTLYATFDCTLVIVEASGALQLSDPQDALERLLADPTLIPVRCDTERREIQTVDAAPVQTSEDAALARGTRIISQLGAPSYVATVTELTYSAGTLVSGSDPVTEPLTEARTTIVRTGVYRAADPGGEPDRDEGAAGREAEGLSFTAPIRNGRISSYFGTREGSMHWGVDYQARAGTEILAPEEGIVVYCGERGEYGFVIDIDHGNGFVSRLTHCADAQVELHQRVFRGEAVAVLAEPDDADERPHLHYELHIDHIPHNPVPYL